MRTGTQLLAGVGFLIVAAVLAGVACNRLFGCPSSNRTVFTWFLEEAERADRLEREGQVELTTRRIDAKHRVVLDVVAGRLSLLDAATRFRDLHRQPPDLHWGEYRRFFPGKNDDERHCRAVIAAVHVHLTSTTGDYAHPLVGRLEDELQSLLDREGLVVLPPSYED
jgi:hypothetical protein